MSVFYFDYETNGLLRKPGLKAHCMSYAFDDEPVRRAVGHDAICQVWQEAVKRGAKEVVAHYATGFDVPVSKKLFRFDPEKHGMQVVDIMVIGSLVDPEFSGKHSLAEWGQRVGAPKDDFQDRRVAALIAADPALSTEEAKSRIWETYDSDMGAYCDQDVETLRKVYQYQKAKWLSQHDWGLALAIEHGISVAMAEQEYNGWHFDMPAAKELEQQMVAFIAERTDKLMSIIKPRCIPGEPVANVFKKDRTPSANALKALGLEPEDFALAWKNEKAEAKAAKRPPDPANIHCPVAGDFSRVSFTEYDLDSRQQVITLLQLHGWKPTEYTEKGNPKFTEDSITAQLGGVGKDLAERFVAITRLGQLRGWMSKVRPDGRIEAKAMPQATPTGRMRHSVVVNVPRPGTKWGPEMRALFGVPPGWVQVGVDAAGLELRMLAHYLGDAEFTRQVISGDIHWYICQLIGLVPQGTVRNKDTHTEEGRLHEAIRNVEKTWILDHV